MGKTNPIFKENYGGYLRELGEVDFSAAGSILDITVDENRRTARIPFFQTPYRVSRFGVVDLDGKRPDYGTCVVLLKYLLMCPRMIPSGDDWVNYRDLKNSGTTQNASLIDYAMRAISKRYAGNKSRLAAAVKALGGRRPETDYPYDLSAVFTVLPRIPILFLFNDADKQFPAQASILFERRAEYFLDAECLVMIGVYLSENLKQAEKMIIG
jgi:hypothetical protein